MKTDNFHNLLIEFSLVNLEIDYILGYNNLFFSEFPNFYDQKML